jgi:RNA polymerase sigma-70 factor, ECF subfamily
LAPAVVPVIAFEVAMDTPINDVATLLGQLNVGDDRSAADLVVLLYSELRRLASSYLRRERGDHTLQTTALGVAARLMRRIWVDYSRGHEAPKPGKDFEKVFREEAESVPQGKAADVIALDEALSRPAEFDPQAQLGELRFFSGLSHDEAAAVLGVSRTTAKRNWNLCKAWLARELRNGDEKNA